MWPAVELSTAGSESVISHDISNNSEQVDIGRL